MKRPTFIVLHQKEIKNLYEEIGFKEVSVIGFPNFVYPNIENNKIEGERANRVKIF